MKEFEGSLTATLGNVLQRDLFDLHLGEGVQASPDRKVCKSTGPVNTEAEGTALCEFFSSEVQEDS